MDIIIENIQQLTEKFLNKYPLNKKIIMSFSLHEKPINEFIDEFVDEYETIIFNIKTLTCELRPMFVKSIGSIMSSMHSKSSPIYKELIIITNLIKELIKSILTRDFYYRYQITIIKIDKGIINDTEVIQIENTQKISLINNITLTFYRSCIINIDTIHDDICNISNIIELNKNELKPEPTIFNNAYM